MNNTMAFISYTLATLASLCFIGGILLSVSMLFGGMALTVMTIKNGDNNNE